MKKLFYVFVVCGLYLATMVSAKSLGVESVAVFGFVSWVYGAICQLVVSENGEQS